MLEQLASLAERTAVNLSRRGFVRWMGRSAAGMAAFGVVLAARSASAFTPIGYCCKYACSTTIPGSPDPISSRLSICVPRDRDCPPQNNCQVWKRVPTVTCLSCR